jgi:long-chain acyl-CoA synthetase
MTMLQKNFIDETRPFFKNFWPHGVPHQFEFDPNLTLKDLLDDATYRWAEEPALWYGDQFYTYKELRKKVTQFSYALAKLGVKKHDPVILLLPNCPQFVIAYYAIVSLGAIVVGVNPLDKPMELQQLFKIVQSKYIILQDEIYEGQIKKIIEDWTFSAIIYTNLADMAAVPPIKKIMGQFFKLLPGMVKTNQKDAYSFMDLLKETPHTPKVEINAEKDAAVFMLTGGTTGHPKAAVLTHQNVVANVKQLELIVTNQHDKDGDRKLGFQTGFIGVLPYFHSFGMTAVMNLSIACGGYQVIFPRLPPTEQLLQTICDLPNKNGFMYCGAEILFQRIATLPQNELMKYDLKGRLRICIAGAGPLHNYVKEPFERKTGARLIEGYGLAEASPVVSVNPFFEPSEGGFIGVPLPGTDWNIFSDMQFEKGPLPFGEKNIGEICVSGPQIMKGYLNEPERTAETLREWGGKTWLLTGDLGYMDPSGRIKIKDRKKQLIKVKGYSVYPVEVENLIAQHPLIQEVLIESFPDEEMGEAIRAIILLKSEAVGKITVEELMNWCKENITHYKVPKEIRILEQPDHPESGKIINRIFRNKE